MKRCEIMSIIACVPQKDKQTHRQTDTQTISTKRILRDQLFQVLISISHSLFITKLGLELHIS